MRARGYGNEFRPHQEIIYGPRNPAYYCPPQVDRLGQLVGEMVEIKTLLQTLVESQHQMLQTLKTSYSNGAGNHYGYGKGEQKPVRDSMASGYPNHHHHHQQASTLPPRNTVNNGVYSKSAANIEKTPISSVNNEEMSDVVPKDDNGQDQQLLQHDQAQQLDNSTGQPATVTQKIVSEKSVEVINKNHVLDGYKSLYDAAEKGDWEKANEFFKKNPNAKTEAISDDSETALHVAVMNDQLKFVEKIVESMPLGALAYRTKRRGNTALHYAAIHGCYKVAAVLVKKNQHLAQVRDKKSRVPLEVALQSVVGGQKKTVEYLYSVTEDKGPGLSPFAPSEGAQLLCKAIDAGFYDMALSLITRFPNLTTVISSLYGVCGLEMMVQRPFAFLSGAKLTWWQQYIYPLIQVDMRPTYNYGGHNTFKYLEGTERDEENPIQSTERIEALVQGNRLESSSISSTGKGKKNMLISVYRMPYIKRVFHIKHLYNQKLMNKQAVALVNEMLEQLNKTMDMTQIMTFFTKTNPNIMKTAIAHGHVEFVAQCLEKFDYLVWYAFAGQTLAHIAIAERNKMALNLIFEASGKSKTAIASRKDSGHNTILHEAAKIASPVQLNLISGLALQMQRELQWFKGVESIIPIGDKFKRNKEMKTAHHVFTESHKDLLEKAEEWMKDTSGSCMVVAALIATVAFAAVFTVPGGNISDTNSSKNGVPVFLGTTPFTIFALADALALFSSVTSVLMFLAVYTSRYAEEDFLRSLPQKMIIGLATLFISMATILVAFGASLYLVLGDKFAWAPIPIAVFGCIPVALFAKLQLPLFVEMVHSTYWGSLFRKYKHIQLVIENNNTNKED